MTGEIVGRHRGDTDVRSHREGGNPDDVHGHKILFASTRGNGYLRRAILAADYVGAGGEMATAEPLYDRLLPRLPGAQVAIADGAKRGKTIEWLQRTHGVIGLAPPAPKRGGKDRDAPRIEKEAFLETVDAIDRRSRQTTSIDIWVRGGAACTIAYDESGDRVFEPLRLLRIHRRGSPGKFRFYAEYQTTTGLELKLRALPTDEDRQRKFNRCENYRLFPPGSDQYQCLYGRRADTESIHRQYKDALWQKRVNVYGSRRVIANARAWAIGQNAIAAYVNRRAARAVAA